MGTSIKRPYFTVAYGLEESNEFRLTAFVAGEVGYVEGLSSSFKLRVPAKTDVIELEANQAGITVQPLWGTPVEMPVGEKVSFPLNGQRTQFSTSVDFEINGQRQRSVVFLVDKMKE